MASSHTHVSAVRNRLLAALPPEILARMLPNLHPVQFTQRQTLYAPEVAIDAVYFPEGGWVSLVATLNEGAQSEVGLSVVRAWWECPSSSGSIGRASRRHPASVTGRFSGTSSACSALPFRDAHFVDAIHENVCQLTALAARLS